MNRTERLTAILLLLQEQSRTAAEISRRFEISRRTVIRDIQALCEMGVPVIAREGPGGGYSLPEGYTLEPPALNPNETFLLLLALKTINRLTDAPYASERASLEAKLRAVLPPDQRATLERTLEKVALTIPERRQRSPFLDSLVEAAAAGNWLSMTYSSSSGPDQVHIFPLEISSQNGYWYCRAFTQERQEERNYRVDRCLDLQPVPEGFDPGPVPSSLPYSHPSHPLVEVELTARGARQIEVEPHLTAAAQRQPDGSAYLAFHCPPSELDYFARYFASLGNEARVLGPLELRRRLTHISQFLLQTYPDSENGDI